MSPESGNRFRGKDMRKIKNLKRTERSWKIATRFRPDHFNVRDYLQPPCAHLANATLKRVPSGCCRRMTETSLAAKFLACSHRRASFHSWQPSQCLPSQTDLSRPSTGLNS